MFAVYRSAARIFLKKSGIQHEVVGQGVFAGLLVNTGQVVRYCLGSVVYTDIGGQKLLKKTHGESIMAMTVKQF